MSNAFDVSSANRLFLIRESIDQGMFAEHVDYTRDPYRVAIDALDGLTGKQWSVAGSGNAQAFRNVALGFFERQWARAAAHRDSLA